MSALDKVDARRWLTLTKDRVAVIAIVVATLLIMRLSWDSFPHPRYNGGIVVAAVGLAAHAMLFSKFRAGLPAWPRAAILAVIVLAAQFTLQSLAAADVLN